MRVEPLALPEVLLIEPVVHTDARGSFFESYHQRRYNEIGLAETFVQDNQSLSRRGVLRGLHAQLRQPQGKLVRVIRGEILDVAVDLRPHSATFGRSVQAALSAENRLQMWIPPGFAHGFQIESHEAEVVYKCTRPYDPEDEIGVVWNDPDLAIAWSLHEPILSSKDRALPTLAELTPRLEAAARGRPE